MRDQAGLSSSRQDKPAAVAVDTRQEPRLHLAVPVKVSSDAKGVDWQSCCTYEISLLGARIAALPGIKQVGQVIWIQRQSRRARYRVAWIGEAGTSQAGQVGVETLEPANVIWEPEIKTRVLNLR